LMRAHGDAQPNGSVAAQKGNDYVLEKRIVSQIEGHVAARSRFKKVLSFVVTNYHVIDKCVGEIRGNLTGESASSLWK